jgi:hypothetical protein
VGLLVMGWNVARYGALLAGGEPLDADLRAFGLSTAGTVLGYGAVFAWLLAAQGFPWAWGEIALPGLMVLMASHVAAGQANEWLDRLAFGGTVSRVRSRLRGVSDRLGRQPDPASALVELDETVAEIVREQRLELPREETGELRLLVEGALRRLNNAPALAEHPLVEWLPAEVRPSRLEGARALRGQMEASVARLQPGRGTRPAPGTQALEGWLHYIVLQEAYVEGRPNKQIMQRYHLSESSFHRARRRAIDALAEEFATRNTGPAEA